MKDQELETRDPPQSGLTKDGVAAVIYGSSGLILIALQILSRFRVLGMAAGVALCIWGAYCIKSKNADDKKPGAVIIAAGVLTVLSKTGIAPLQIVSGTILSMGSFALLALGAVSAVKFIAGLKKRS